MPSKQILVKKLRSSWMHVRSHHQDLRFVVHVEAALIYICPFSHNGNINTLTVFSCLSWHYEQNTIAELSQHSHKSGQQVNSQLDSLTVGLEGTQSNVSVILHQWPRKSSFLQVTPHEGHQIEIT